ncbi:MAG: T9SS type A sorting domain-containing protein, partial [Saprospiraceae bacterium]|nr:T9SS type A sorting domain-containing protein [Saprospiraceae bacterium]
ASSGTPPYDYLWSNGAVTPVIADAAPGDYQLTVTDAKGCEIYSTTVKIPERVPPLSLETFTVSAVSCYNGSDASMTATISGGGGFYLYHFTPTYIEVTDAESVTVGQLLHSPEYSVTVTDLNTGCVVSSASQYPTQPDPLAVERDNISIVNCFGGSDGGVYITASGGIGPYNYQWFNEDGQLISIAEDLLFIPAGLYTVLVTDANGCEISLENTVTNSGNTVIQLIDSLTIIQHVRCRGDATGAIDISLSGGIPPFSYVWNNGMVTEDLVNIPAGTYEVTITDADTCRSIIPGITVTQPAQHLLPNAQLVPPSCYNSTDGAIVTTASGGVPPYTYTWQQNGINLPGETGPVLSGISGGDYRLILQDAGGCVRFFNLMLTAPDTLEVDIEPALSDQPITATAIATGGTPDYAYLWNTNAMTSQIEVLLSGFYAVTVTDASDCTGTASLLINDVEEIPKLRQMRIFPNPTKGGLQVEFELDRAAAVSWKLLDAYGRVVWEQNPAATHRESRSIDLRPHPSGAYLLQLWSEGNLLFRERVLKLE